MDTRNTPSLRTTLQVHFTMVENCMPTMNVCGLRRVVMNECIYIAAVKVWDKKIVSSLITVSFESCMQVHLVYVFKLTGMRLSIYLRLRIINSVLKILETE